MDSFLKDKDKVHQINDTFLLEIKQLTRDKFMLVSFKGFFACVFLLAVAGVMEVFISDSYNDILYISFSFLMPFVFLLNQMTFRGLLTPYK